MPTYKRKPMSTVSPPQNVTDNTEVFVIRGTNEIFTDYESYLKRYEYLSQKKFVDSVNGKSGLNFWDALESETKSQDAIETIFPEVLKDPILRKVQFSTISRIDELVNTVYDEFKRDFFPGETVQVLLTETEQIEGLIREKAKFPMIRGPDGAVQRAAFSRYFVRLPDMPDKEALVDDKHIRRDRKVFTKQNLRAFLKNSLQRESWIGAPWLVKEHLAIQYRLPMEIPGHLLQDAKLLASKVYMRHAVVQHAPAGFVRNPADQPLQQQMLQMKPPKGRRSNKSDEIARQQQELARVQAIQQQHPGAPMHQIQQIADQQRAMAAHLAPPRPPPVLPPKYPMEDLDLPLKRDGITRPQLNFLTDEQKEFVLSGRRIEFEDISMDSVGMLLEIWNTLNVQCEVYVLDSFTFDDFVDAMRYHETDPACELLDEMHCAVLKQLVDKNGKVLVKGGLLDMVAEVEDEISDVHDESELSTPQPDVPARSTRSRLSHVDPAVENPRTPTGDKPNRAAEMLGDRSWKTRLVARDFVDGGWQVILVGLLHQCAANPALKPRCDKILAELAPIDMPPTQETALQQYTTLDINLRASALQMITILSISTAAVKDFLDQCNDDMTDVRKRKIEHQREKKALVEELQYKDRDRKILWPQNMPESPKPESVEPVSINGETDGDDTLETNGASGSDLEDGAPKSGRSLRRGSDRKRKRDEDTARREKERAEKAAADKEKNKQTKEFKKLLKDIEDLKERIVDHEEKIQECDADLREANVQRTKVLGKDRFCNRYYWFERNGQPFGGLPRSSTAGYGYANARIWVQGPDEMEADGFINLPPDEQKIYRQRFGCTVLERRKQDEGATSLLNANEWGYYDDPARLDNLIGWLDERGEREKKLRKELCEWRDIIVQYMETYKAFHDSEAAKRVEVEEEQASRVSTRHKEKEEQVASKERCLKWTNTMAIDDLGHIHSKPSKKAPKSKAKQAKGVATLVSRTTGKPVTRQGGSYSFK